MASLGANVATVLAASIAATAANADVTISSAATNNLVCSSGVCLPTAKNAVLNIGDLEALLASGNVEVATAGVSVQAKSIRIKASFNWSNSSVLTLDAYDSIAVERPVLNSAGGGLTVTTNDGGSEGMFLFGPKGSITFASPTSDLTINGTAFTLVQTLPDLAGAVAADPSGAFALASDYDAEKDGVYGAAPIRTTFSGMLEGLGNTITNIRIRGNSRSANLGFLAEVDASGSVSSLRIKSMEIRGKKGSEVGVLAGESFGTVFNSFAHGKIAAAAGDAGGGAFGGLVGGNGGIIAYSAASVRISVGSKGAGTDADAGGLAGANIGTIEKSYSTGRITVSGTAAPAAVGGFLGWNDGIVDNCYAEGAATEVGAGSAAVGGMIGENAQSVSSSYATGIPAGAGGSYVGGFTGTDVASINKAYWDMTTSGIANKRQGAGNVENDPGITGRTTAQLQSGLPSGFNAKLWTENSNTNGGLPYLVDNPPM